MGKFEGVAYGPDFWHRGGGSPVTLDVVDVQGNRLHDLAHLFNKPVVPMDVVVVSSLTASLGEDSHVGREN